MLWEPIALLNREHFPRQYPRISYIEVRTHWIRDGLNASLRCFPTSNFTIQPLNRAKQLDGISGIGVTIQGRAKGDSEEGKEERRKQAAQQSEVFNNR